LEWKRIISENTPANPRFGHTALLYNRRLILFGGKTKISTYTQFCDLEIFNFDDKQWSIPIVYTKSTLKLRSYHVAELIGNTN